MEFFVIKKQHAEKSDYAFAAFWNHMSAEIALKFEATTELQAARANVQNYWKKVLCYLLWASRC